MKAKFKVIGTNGATEHLMDSDGLLIKTYNPAGCTIREILFEGESYFFDEKSVDFLPNAVVISGWLSNEKSIVGRVALKFIPEND